MVTGSWAMDSGSTCQPHPIQFRTTPSPPTDPDSGLIAELPSDVISFKTTEGTNVSVDVSPDGQTLVFDLLGDLYLLPIQGGDAKPVTAGRAWDQHPLFSPDGEYLYFVSDRNGHKNLWRLKLSKESLHQVTFLNSDIMGGLSWSQYAHRLIAAVGEAETSNVEVTLHAIDPLTGEVTPIDESRRPWIDMDTFNVIRSPIRVYKGTQASDGDIFLAQAIYEEQLKRYVVRMYRLSGATGTRDAVTPADALYNDYHPQLSPDGMLLAYFRQYPDRTTEIRVRNIATEKDHALLRLTPADDAFYGASQPLRPSTAFTPDSNHFMFSHGGKIQRVDLTDGSSSIIPFQAVIEREVWDRARPPLSDITRTGEASVIRWPTFSRDGSMLAFAAIGYVWILDAREGCIRRLTRSNDFEFMPAIAPNGRSVAFISFDKSDGPLDSARLLIENLDDDSLTVLLDTPKTRYLIPKWSHDGSRIALIRETETATGLEAEVGWTSVKTAQFHRVASTPASDDRSSFYIYSRYVGFDVTGDHLLFSLPDSRNRIVLAAARLDGSARTILAKGSRDVAGITPAPDLTSLALTRRDGTVWAVPFSATANQLNVSTSSADSLRLSPGGGYYIAWSNKHEVTFGFGRDLYRHNSQGGELEVLPVELQFNTPKAARPIAFVGARLITMDQVAGCRSIIPTGTLVIEGQRISAVGSVGDVAIPSGALIADVAGKTIIPGLIDTHYHRIGGSNGALGLSAFKLPNPGFGDTSAIAYGITTAWEPGGPANDGVPATADLQESGRLPGPRWSHAAMGSVGYPWKELSSYDAAVAAVQQHHALGVDVLKEYATPTREQRQWLSAAAHQEGLGIVSHIDNLEIMLTGIVDGYTGGDHSYIPIPFYKDVLEMLRQTGYIWTPNIMISGGSLGPSSDAANYYWQRVFSKRPSEREKLRAFTFTTPKEKQSFEPNVPYSIHRVSRIATQAVAAAKAGVHVGVSAHNMPGARLHGEMWHLWRAGLSVEDVLRATTVGNARKLGLQEEIGTLEPGRVADILILRENPLDDITNTMSIEYVVMEGVVYDGETGKQVDLLDCRSTGNCFNNPH